MKRFFSTTTLLAFAFASVITLAATTASAREGQDQIMGTVTRAEKGWIEVKKADGKLVEVLVTAATVFTKGKASASIADVKQSARVTVEATKGKAGLEAMKVQIEAAAVIYTCPMHPEVQQPGPGKCPKCGMNLEKKD
jgi:Heavy metal binding domain